MTIATFVFEASRNASLITDIICDVSDTGAPPITPAPGLIAPTGLITATVPASINIADLIATITLNSGEQIYPATAQNFSSGAKLYSVIYDDSSIKVYYVSIAKDTGEENIVLENVEIMYMDDGIPDPDNPGQYLEYPTYYGWVGTINELEQTVHFTIDDIVPPGNFTGENNWKKKWFIRYDHTGAWGLPAVTPPGVNSWDYQMTPTAKDIELTNYEIADGAFIQWITIMGSLINDGDWQTIKRYPIIIHFSQSPEITSTIVDFRFEASNNPLLTEDCIGVINNMQNTISVSVPAGTDVTSLVPTITRGGTPVLHPGRYDWIYPASGVAKDFTHTVAYSVCDTQYISNPPNNIKTFERKTYQVTVTEAV